MKRFSDYLNEDFDPAIFNADGGISINDPTVVDAINSNLEVATSCSYRTPYNGLEEVAKTLAYYKIFLPKGVFLDQNHGNDVFEVSQFGEKMGMNNDGEVVTASDSPLFVYFEWSLNEKGMYDTFACLCDQDELDEILADYDSEVETDEDLQEQHSMGKVSKMLYKIVNQSKAAKQSADVDDYIEHEKQGKTFTQTNEEAMPNPKKKMAAKVKAITLAGQMRKEETINELKMDKKTYVSAMQRTTGYDADYSGEEGRVDRDKLIARAKKYKGAKFAKQLAGADQMTSRPNRNVVSGQWGSDQLSWRKPSRKTKSGKANKQDLAALKASMKKGDYRKPSFKKRKLPEEKEPFDPPFKKVQRTKEKDAARARQLAKKAEKEAKAKKK